MKLKVFLILMAFASSAFAQITCPNDTTVGKFINPHKNKLNLENLEYVCEDMEADLPSPLIELEYESSWDFLANASRSSINVNFTGVPSDGCIVTVNGTTIEFDSNSSDAGSDLVVDLTGKSDKYDICVEVVAELGEEYENGFYYNSGGDYKCEDPGPTYVSLSSIEIGKDSEYPSFSSQGTCNISEEEDSAGSNGVTIGASGFVMLFDTDSLGICVKPGGKTETEDGAACFTLSTEE